MGLQSPLVPAADRRGYRARHAGRVQRRTVGSAGLFGYVTACFFVVALGYSGGRWHAGWAPTAYWTGEVLLFLGVAYRALSRRSSWGDRVAAVMLYAAAQSAISWAYSPDMFRYSDELQHLASLLHILQSHHLFHVNYALPVSPRYPGLESVTAAITQTTGLSAFASGLILVAVCHLLMASALLLLYRTLTHSDRVAAASALVYALGTDQAITRLFVYEAMALPFLVLALRMSIRASTPRRWARPAGIALACVLIVTMTHHVTAIAVVLLLAFLGFGFFLVAATGPATRRLLLITLGATAIVGIWIAVVARATVSYLGGPLEDAAYGALAGKGSGTAAAPGTQGTLWEHALSLSGPLITLIVLPLGTGWLLSRRWWRASALMRVWALGSLSFFAVLVIRVGAANGTELSSRSLAYTSFFSAFVIGFVVDRLMTRVRVPFGPLPTQPRRQLLWRRVRGPIAGLGVVLLFVSGLISAIPPAYERLPGTFHIDGFESGIDAANIAAARWSGRALGPGNQVFGDFTALTLWPALGNQNAVLGDVAVVQAYEAPSFSTRGIGAVRQLGIQYFEVDTRMTQQPPVRGSYFATPDNEAGAPRTKPLPASALAKFDRVPGISRVYDNGVIRLYDLRGTPYAG